jgi:hypothetical protein
MRPILYVLSGVLAILSLFGMSLLTVGSSLAIADATPPAIQAPTGVWDQVDLKCGDNNLFGVPFSQVMNVNTVLAAAVKRGYQLEETTFDWEGATAFYYLKPLCDAQITLISDSEAHMNGFVVSVRGGIPVLVAAAKEFLERMKTCPFTDDLSDPEKDMRGATWTLKHGEVVELYMQGDDQHAKLMVGVMIRWHEPKDKRGNSHSGTSVKHVIR